MLERNTQFPPNLVVCIGYYCSPFFIDGPINTARWYNSCNSLKFLLITDNSVFYKHVSAPQNYSATMGNYFDKVFLKHEDTELQKHFKF